MTMRFEDVAMLLRQLDSAEGQSVDIRFGQWQMQVVAWPQAAPPSIGSLEATPVSAPTAPTDHHQSALSATFTTVTSSGIGLFRSADVKPGTRIESGQCIGEILVEGADSIPVLADQAGVLVDVYPKDGDRLGWGDSIARLDI